MKTFSSKLFHLFDIHYFTRILPTIFVYYTLNLKPISQIFRFSVLIPEPLPNLFQIWFLAVHQDSGSVDLGGNPGDEDEGQYQYQ